VIGLVLGYALCLCLLFLSVYWYVCFFGFVIVLGNLYFVVRCFVFVFFCCRRGVWLLEMFAGFVY